MDFFSPFAAEQFYYRLHKTTNLEFNEALICLLIAMERAIFNLPALEFLLVFRCCCNRL